MGTAEGDGFEITPALPKSVVNACVVCLDGDERRGPLRVRVMGRGLRGFGNAAVMRASIPSARLACPRGSGARGPPLPVP